MSNPLWSKKIAFLYIAAAVSVSCVAQGNEKKTNSSAHDDVLATAASEQESDAGNSPQGDEYITARGWSATMPESLIGVWYENSEQGKNQCAFYKELRSIHDFNDSSDPLVGSVIIRQHMIHAYSEYGEGNFHSIKNVIEAGITKWKVESMVYIDSPPADEEIGDVARYQLTLKSGLLYWTGISTSDSADIDDRNPAFFRCGSVLDGMYSEKAPGEDISHFISRDLIIHLDRREDIDGDGDSDALVVLQSADNDKHRLEPRTLMVLQRNANGDLENTEENRAVILCQSCGGMFGDPLREIQVFPGGFLLRFEGGSRELWSRDYRFSYSKDVGTWLLSEARDSSLDRLDGSAIDRQLKLSNFEPVSTERFDPEIFATDPIL